MLLLISEGKRSNSRCKTSFASWKIPGTFLEANASSQIILISSDSLCGSNIDCGGRCCCCKRCVREVTRKREGGEAVDLMRCCICDSRWVTTETQRFVVAVVVVAVAVVIVETLGVSAFLLLVDWCSLLLSFTVLGKFRELSELVVRTNWLSADSSCVTHCCESPRIMYDMAML